MRCIALRVVPWLIVWAVACDSGSTKPHETDAPPPSVAGERDDQQGNQADQYGERDDQQDDQRGERDDQQDDGDSSARPSPTEPLPESATPSSAPTLADLEYEPVSCRASKTRKAPGVSPRTTPKGKTYVELQVRVTNPAATELSFEAFAVIGESDPLAPQDTTLMKAMAKGGRDYRRFAQPQSIGPGKTVLVAWLFLTDEGQPASSMELRDPSNTHKVRIPVSCDAAG